MRRRAPRIFLSYRREDASGHAGRLYDVLARRYGEQNVFMDVDAIAVGSDFARVIRDAVAGSDALIALIGREWRTVADEHGRRRLDDPNDFVRLEVEAALAADVAVVPVCVGGAVFPDPEELPESLAPLGRRQGTELRDSAWREDVARLLRRLDDVVRPQEAARRRAWRARRRVLLVAAVAAAALLAALAVWRLGDGGNGNGERSLTAADRELLTFVPAITRPHCEPIDWGDKAARAAVSCDSAGIAVRYHLFESEQLRDAWYARQRDSVGVDPRSGACSATSFGGERTYDGSANGEYTCWLDEEEPYLAWKHGASAVGAEANSWEEGGRAGAARLLRQWQCCLRPSG